MRSDVGRYAMTPEWLVRSVDSKALHVWCYITAVHADRKTDICHVSRQEIGDALGFSISTVSRAFAALEEAGAIKRNPRFIKGSQVENEFVIYFANPDRSALEGPNECSPLVTHDTPPLSPVTPPLVTSDPAIPSSPESHTRSSSSPSTKAQDGEEGVDLEPPDPGPNDEVPLLVEPDGSTSLPSEVEEAFAQLVETYDDNDVRKVMFSKDFDDQLTIPAAWCRRDRKSYLTADEMVTCVRLAVLLSDECQGAGNRPPNPFTHDAANTMRLLMVKDEKPVKHVEALIHWTYGDSFWQTNILSHKKFREQWDKLRGARNRDLERRNRDRVKDAPVSQDWMARSSVPQAV